MAGTLDVFQRQVDIRNLMDVLRPVTGASPLRGAGQYDLDAAAVTVAQAIKRQRVVRQYIHRTDLTYSSEEDLLRQADQMTDFLILDLADHYRYYDWTKLPGYAGARYMSSVRDSQIVHKRMSGHVTASIAEAMCPWVFERLGITRGVFFTRFASLARGEWGAVMPDFVFWSGTGEVPCEAKHYSRGVRWKAGVPTAVVQVAAAMTVMQVSEGYIFMVIDGNVPRYRYEVEVVRLVC